MTSGAKAYVTARIPQRLMSKIRLHSSILVSNVGEKWAASIVDQRLRYVDSQRSHTASVQPSLRERVLLRKHETLAIGGDDD